MKKIIVLMTLLASSYSYAGEACSAYYAAGLGHVFKGEAQQLGEVIKLTEGQSTGDELYTMTIINGAPELKETRSGSAVRLSSSEMGTAKIYTTGSLKKYPSGVADKEHRFVIIICADDSAF
ncbi:hypothetical protein [uncultured Bdellovibrio sp.]|uniref:hypothetical protein n=1 Tax=Bdellovibrio sp. HCB-162 TaxID=3394234 RepID=UPI0025D198D2|nr:hypothetical protein [uncultured Bdellovibrio sp.]